MKLLNLASNNSFWRGIDYHNEKRVISWKKLTDNCYQGQVNGNEGATYDVTIDIMHPRKSNCNCPFAKGRRVVCKHMVALELEIFPKKEKQMLDYIEKQNQIYEQEYEKEMLEREEEIKTYVMKLTKAELRDLLIQRMIDDLYM